jgi:hypothetical protein
VVGRTGSKGVLRPQSLFGIGFMWGYPLARSIKDTQCDEGMCVYVGGRHKAPVYNPLFSNHFKFVVKHSLNSKFKDFETRMFHSILQWKTHFFVVMLYLDEISR